MQIIAFVTEASSIRRILDHLGEPTEPSPLSPARDPPERQGDPRDFDPGADPPAEFDLNVDPEPEFDTDQSVAW